MELDLTRRGVFMITEFENTPINVPLTKEAHHTITYLGTFNAMRDVVDRIKERASYLTIGMVEPEDIALAAHEVHKGITVVNTTNTDNYTFWLVYDSFFMPQDMLEILRIQVSI